MFVVIGHAERSSGGHGAAAAETAEQVIFSNI